ncbi:MAG: hypothetical protein WD969_17080 [Paracoccaceae bacterium]
MISSLRIAARRASGFPAACEGAVNVDWVVITSMVVVLGVGIVYFILGPDGGVVGLLETMTAGVNQTSSNISGTASAGAGVVPGGGGTDG